MPEAVSARGDEFATIIGADAHFKGELTFQGGVRIDGQFEGSIHTSGKVLVTKGGKVKAEVKSGSIVLEGTIEGNVIAEDRVELRASGVLHGDLKAGKLLVQEGATLAGRCEIGPVSAAPARPTGAAEPVSAGAGSQIPRTRH